jgi:hypothetical protein
MISASKDFKVHIWDTEEGCQIALLPDCEHTREVFCLAMFRDNLFISGSADCSMIMWDISSFKMNSIIKAIPFDIEKSVINQNKILYPSGESLRIWDLISNEVLEEFRGHLYPVTCMALNFDLIATGGEDRRVKVWSLQTNSLVGTFEGHEKFVRGVAISGNVLASGSDDLTVRVWNISENKKIGVLYGHSQGVETVALTSDAKKVVSGGRDTFVHVWSVNKLLLLFKFSGHTGWICEVSISIDEKYVFSASIKEESVRVWEMEKNREVCCWKNQFEAKTWLIRYPEIRNFTEKFIP